MATWSLTIIARDVERELATTLDSITGIFDEVVVVDTGSTDGTVAVAESRGARVGRFEWVDDFAAARNYALSLATCDWVAWMDTGDVILPGHVADFLALKSSPSLDDPAVLGVACRFDRVMPDGTVVDSTVKARLARRELAVWTGAVHETLGVGVPDGEPWAIHHPATVTDPIPEGGSTITDRNLRILRRMVEAGEGGPRIRFYLAYESEARGMLDEAVGGYSSLANDRCDDVASRYYGHMAAVKGARLLTARGDREGAIELLTRATRIDPRKAEAFTLLGDAYEAENEYDLAIPYYRAAVGSPEPVDGSFYHPSGYGFWPLAKLGLCLANSGQPSAALPILEAARRSVPADKAAELDEAIEKVRGVLK